MQVLVHVVVVGVMLRFPCLELTLDPPGRGVRVLFLDLIDVVELASCPLAVDEKHFDHGAFCHQVRFGSLSPLMADVDMPPILVVEADLRKPTVAHYDLWGNFHVLVKGLNVLVDGGRVMRLGAGEVEGESIDIALH